MFLVSVRPLITVSGESYINSIIEDAGGVNLFHDENTPYPILSLEYLLMADPDAVVTMNADDRDYLASMLEDYGGARFVRLSNIFATGDGSVPYYSPERYVESVEKFALIFRGIKQ